MNDTIEIGKATRLGNRRINQDRCLTVESEGCVLLALADGMGGHPRGERAAEILMENCESVFQRTRKPVANPGEFLLKLLQQAHEQIVAFGANHTPPIEPRTTAVLVLIQKGVAHWAHAGDSRFYLFRDHRPAARTTDHSYVEKLRQSGLISEQQRDNHPQRHYVTRCLGGPLTTPGATLGEPTRLRQNDLLLLCTDGFWSHTEEEEMIAAFEDQTQTVQRVVDDLVEEAALKGYPESDNVTAVGMRWRGSEEPAANGAAGQGSAEHPQDRLALAIEELTSAIDRFESRNRGEK